MSLIFAVVIVVFLVAGNAFFVALEFALVAADKPKIQKRAEEGNFGAKATLKTLKELSFHLSGAQLGITVTSLVLGFLTDSVVRDILSPVFTRVPFLNGPTISILVALFVATVFQLVAGELIPKNIAIAKPNAVAQLLSPIANILHLIFRPVIYLFNASANWVVRRIGIEPKEELADILSLEDLEYLVVSPEGSLSKDTRNLIGKTIKFGDKVAADALTPRVDVDFINYESNLSDFIVYAANNPHSKFPVVEDDLDSVVGVVDIAAVFSVPYSQRGMSLVKEIMKPVVEVPETRDLIDILEDFKHHNSQMLIVVDEYGGVAGILTLEDVLEEIVGDIDDEYDDSVSLTMGVIPGTYFLAGTLHPDEVFEYSGFEIPEGDYETIAGFVLSELGKIPNIGDHFFYNDWRIEVRDVDKLRIASIQLNKPGVN